MLAYYESSRQVPRKLGVKNNGIMFRYESSLEDTGDAMGVVQALDRIGEQAFMLELKVVRSSSTHSSLVKESQVLAGS